MEKKEAAGDDVQKQPEFNLKAGVPDSCTEERDTSEGHMHIRLMIYLQPCVLQKSLGWILRWSM